MRVASFRKLCGAAYACAAAFAVIGVPLAGADTVGVDDGMDDIPEESVTDEYDAYRRIVYLQGCQLDVKTAWRWLALAKMLRPDPNASKVSVESIINTRSVVSQLASLAMIYTGQTGVFRSELMPNIINLEAFQNWVYEPCDRCEGTFSYSYADIFSTDRNKKGSGKIKDQCRDCKGTGKCPYPGCNGGSVEIRHRVIAATSANTGGSSVTQRKCTSCHGTGQCRSCNGKGFHLKTCPKCGGKGAKMSKLHIAHVYGTLLPHATAFISGDIDKIREDKKRREIDQKSQVDPRSQPEKPYDSVTNTYDWAKADREILAKITRQKRKSIAVYVNTDVMAKASPTVSPGGKDMGQLAASLQSDIQSQLAELEYLRPVASNPDLLNFINSGFDGNALVEADVPDYILIGKLVSMNVLQSGVYEPVSVKVYFELYDRDSNAVRYSVTLSRKDAYSPPGGALDSLQELFTNVAREYMERIADKVGPVGVVSETRNGGEYAYISLGTDAGLRAGTRVQILEKRNIDAELGGLVATSYVSGNVNIGTLSRGADFGFVSVADGRVVESVLPEPKNSWIMIDNFNPKNPRVKRGMAVRIVPSPQEKIAYP